MDCCLLDACSRASFYYFYAQVWSTLHYYARLARGPGRPRNTNFSFMVNTKKKYLNLNFLTYSELLQLHPRLIQSSK